MSIGKQIYEDLKKLNPAFNFRSLFLFIFGPTPQHQPSPDCWIFHWLDLNLFFFFFSQPFSNKKALLICFGAGGAGGVLFHRHFSFLAKWIFQLGHYLTNCATPFTAPSKMMWHKNHPEKIITISRQKQSNPHPRRSSRPKHTFSVGGGLHLASLTWAAVAVGGAEPEK